MEKELQQIKSQQHDAKHAELSPSDDSKILELEGDDGKHRKTQPNSLLNAATGTASTSATKEENKTRYVNTNMTKLFDKPFIPKTQKDIFIPPQESRDLTIHSYEYVYLCKVLAVPVAAFNKLLGWVFRASTVFTSSRLPHAYDFNFRMV
ncbi:hypothetical protein H5410_062014 [Solanum commersonii]|uniref:Uncharacterized protein n=1 Tax=Solanum commersonii TaxID=4109 RepID=A0A9J5WAY8_SOLCO|nr:hypothetical protein H5410_062014 [Solanum commersonii]